MSAVAAVRVGEKLKSYDFFLFRAARVKRARLTACKSKQFSPTYTKDKGSDCDDYRCRGKNNAVNIC